MKKSILLCFMFLLITSLFSTCNLNNTKENTDMDKTLQDIRAANDQFYAALNEMFTGKLEPMNEIWSHRDDVTDLGPFGDRLVGWNAVGAEFKKEAEMKLGGKVVCKDLLVRAGTDMAYTTCTEEGENMSADGKPVIVKFRATNIFRLENGKWKLAHHHTDLSAPLQEATKK